MTNRPPAEILAILEAGDVNEIADPDVAAYAGYLADLGAHLARSGARSVMELRMPISPIEAAALERFVAAAATALPELTLVLPDDDDGVADAPRLS